MKVKFRLTFIVSLILAAAAGCAPSRPVLSPSLTMVEPTPVITVYPSPSPTLSLSPTPLPSDAAFESAVEPLSRADFTLTLQNGVFCLLDQGCSELEELTGKKFEFRELQTDELLFTQIDDCIESVFYLEAPTARGIKRGDTLDAVLEAYGTPSEINDLNESASYIYYIEPEPSDNMDFTVSRPLWYYAVGFSIYDGHVERAFIADWISV